MQVRANVQAKPLLPTPLRAMDKDALLAPDPRRLREMLRRAGLKASMPRLKVLEILYLASWEGGELSSRRLHERLQDAGEPLTLVSVRQVLGRMVDSGLVIAEGGHRYRLAPNLAPTGDQRPRSNSAA
ncbi:hypothetical protein LMK08_09990 [Metapseudomonas furukawaii]|uniref:hypothetical protein n=1 Tax=Metapseudomonas furukawaii TaxID=1149133 RepID=UPI00227D4962|nr:hypothetical protein [Pseudomonas furukawaii]WAG80961.1 hypothetical protein LMK08_09990 [Pseudomonas furukawaii]